MALLISNRRISPETNRLQLGAKSEPGVATTAVAPLPIFLSTPACRFSTPRSLLSAESGWCVCFTADLAFAFRPSPPFRLSLAIRITIGYRLGWRTSSRLDYESPLTPHKLENTEIAGVAVGDGMMG